MLSLFINVLLEAKYYNNFQIFMISLNFIASVSYPQFILKLKRNIERRDYTDFTYKNKFQQISYKL